MTQKPGLEAAGVKNCPYCGAALIFDEGVEVGGAWFHPTTDEDAADEGEPSCIMSAYIVRNRPASIARWNRRASDGEGAVAPFAWAWKWASGGEWRLFGAETSEAARADFIRDVERTAPTVVKAVYDHPAPVAAQPAEGWVTVPRDLERGLLERLAGRWGYTLEETADAYSVMVEVMASSPTPPTAPCVPAGVREALTKIVDVTRRDMERNVINPWATVGDIERIATAALSALPAQPNSSEGEPT